MGGSNEGIHNIIAAVLSGSISCAFNAKEAMSTPDVHGISFDPKSKVFRLESSRSLYAFRVTARGELEHLYFGAKLSRDDDLSLFALSAKDCATPFDPSGQQVVKDTDPFDLQHLTTDELKAYWEESTKMSRVRAQHGEDSVHERRKETAERHLWRDGALSRDGRRRVIR